MLHVEKDPACLCEDWIFGCDCVFVLLASWEWQARLQGDEWSNSASVMGDYPQMEQQATMYNSNPPHPPAPTEWQLELNPFPPDREYYRIVWWVSRTKCALSNTVPCLKIKIHFHFEKTSSNPPATILQSLFSNKDSTENQKKKLNRKKVYKAFFCLFFVLVSVTMNPSPYVILKCC